MFPLHGYKMLMYTQWWNLKIVTPQLVITDNHLPQECKIYTFSRDSTCHNWSIDAMLLAGSPTPMRLVEHHDLVLRGGVS